MRQAFLTLSHLKVSRLVIIFRDKKDKVAPIFLKVAANCSFTLGNSERKITLDVSFICFRSKCHNSPFSLCKLIYLTSYLGTLTFHKVQTIFFCLKTLIQSNNLLPFLRKSVRISIIFFFNPVHLEYLPLIFKVTKRQNICRISKVITFLESLSQVGWFDILFKSDIQAL